MFRLLLLGCMFLVSACNESQPPIMDSIPTERMPGSSKWPSDIPEYSKIYITNQNENLEWDVVEVNADFFNGAYHSYESYWPDKIKPIACDTSLPHVKVMRSLNLDEPCKTEELFEVIEIKGEDVQFIGHCTYHKSQWMVDEDRNILIDKRGKPTFEKEPIIPVWRCRVSGTVESQSQKSLPARIAIYFPINLIAEIPINGFE